MAGAQDDGSSVRVAVARLRGGAWEAVEDAVAVEEPLEIRVRERSVGALMRTPGHDEELAAGYVFTEGVVTHPRDVRYAVHCRTTPLEARGNVIHVMVPEGATIDVEGLDRRAAASSACGVCGRTSLEEVLGRVAGARVAPLATPLRIAELEAAMAAMRAGQGGFDRTGGLHAAGLWDRRRGRLVALREDVGRHNAVDKVVGWALLARRVPLREHLLVVSGRAGFEIIQKAIVAGIGAVASVSAPSSLAVAASRAAGLLLLGFVRPERLNVYSLPAAVEGFEPVTEGVEE